MIEEFDGLTRNISLINSGVHPVLQFILLILAAIFIVLPWYLLYLSHRHNKVVRLMKALPTSKVRGVFIGLVELKGISESAFPLTSYLTGQQCVWYRYEIEEQWSRTVTSTDSKGNTTTSTESGWQTIASEGSMQDFYLTDDTGSILIIPDKADVDSLKVLDQVFKRKDPIYYEKGPQESVSHSDHRRRFTERVIPVGVPLYIVGTSRERQDIVAPEIAYADGAPMYRISVKNEEAVVSSFNTKAWWSAIGGFLIVVAVPFIPWVRDPYSPNLLTSMMQGDIPFWFAAALLYLSVWIGSWCWIVYNSLVDIRNRVRRAESHIDVQLNRRHDLIPRLAEVVTAYSNHESLTQQQVAQLRTSVQHLYDGAEQIGILAESYPGLKAQELFAELSKQLKDTEDRIALAREYFNSIANHYNTLLEIMPDGIVASLFRLRPFKSR